MTETYIRLRCNEPPDTVQIDPDHLLQDLYRFLDCTCIETVHLAGGYVMIIDESGKLNGKPFNPIASLLYSPKKFHDWIAGNAILAKMGLRDGETDIVSLGTNETELTFSQALTIWNRIQRRNGEEI